MQIMYQLSEYYNQILTLTSVNTSKEIKTLDKTFKKRGVKSILDVACGVGRHSIPLAKLGYKVTGIDYSLYQLKVARKEAKLNKSTVSFYLKNANSFSFPSKFDAAICMWSTLGEEPMIYQKVIKNVHKVLKKGGVYVVDNKNWENVNKKEKVREDLIKKPGFILKRKMWDRYTENFRVRQAVFEIDSKKYDELCVTHTLNTIQWKEALKEGGFKKFEVLHDYEKYYKKRAKRVQIVATK